MRLICALLTLLVILGAGLAMAESVDLPLPSVQAENSFNEFDPPSTNKNARNLVDYQMNVIRAGIVILGLVIFLWVWSAPGRPSSGARKMQTTILLLLAMASFASYYQFFQYSHVRGFATSDNFHYYLGSKYFPELGYFGIYECSLYALTERGLSTTGSAETPVRNLRTMEPLTTSEVVTLGTDCPSRFSHERWQAFGDEVQYFSHKWPLHIRKATWLDHGYHPPPAWTLVGGALGQKLNVNHSHNWLARIDRILILFTLLGILWAFGLKTACLVALIWGTGTLWRYTWVGDAFLRHLWWISAIWGVIALRRGRNTLAGSALTLSALFRIFPGALGLGYLLHATREGFQKKNIPPRSILFMTGAMATLLIVTLGAAWFSGHGFSVYQEFAMKLSRFTDAPISNDIGLSTLAEWLFPSSETLSNLTQGVLIGLFIALFWRAMARIADWEAAAAGVLLIPILVSPANYYFSFFAIAALVATQRPRMGVILIVTAVLWDINGLLLYQQYSEFNWASVISVISCFALILELGQPLKALKKSESDTEATAMTQARP